jgi:hypothetical protein
MVGIALDLSVYIGLLGSEDVAIALGYSWIPFTVGSRLL